MAFKVINVNYSKYVCVEDLIIYLHEIKDYAVKAERPDEADLLKSIIEDMKNLKPMK